MGGITGPSFDADLKESQAAASSPTPQHIVRVLYNATGPLERRRRLGYRDASGLGICGLIL
jgi:hypothetical protein